MFLREGRGKRQYLAHKLVGRKVQPTESTHATFYYPLDKLVEELRSKMKMHTKATPVFSFQRARRELMRAFEMTDSLTANVVNSGCVTERGLAQALDSVNFNLNEHHKKMLLQKFPNLGKVQLIILLGNILTWIFE